MMKGIGIRTVDNGFGKKKNWWSFLIRAGKWLGRDKTGDIVGVNCDELECQV